MYCGHSTQYSHLVCFDSRPLCMCDCNTVIYRTVCTGRQDGKWMLYGWEGNHRSVVTLAIHHRLCDVFACGLSDLGNRDKHLAYTPVGLWHPLPFYLGLALAEGFALGMSCPWHPCCSSVKSSQYIKCVASCCREIRVCLLRILDLLLPCLRKSTATVAVCTSCVLLIIAFLLFVTFYMAYSYRWCSVVCWSVCRSVTIVSHARTDQDAVQVVNLGWPKEACIRWGFTSPHGNGQFWGRSGVPLWSIWTTINAWLLINSLSYPVLCDAIVVAHNGVFWFCM